MTIPADQAVILPRKGIESLKPLGPPSPEQLRLMHARISNREDHTQASTQVKQKMSFKRTYGLLNFWLARLRDMIHIPKAESSNVRKPDY